MHAYLTSVEAKQNTVEIGKWMDSYTQNATTSGNTYACHNLSLTI